MHPAYSNVFLTVVEHSEPESDNGRLLAPGEGLCAKERAKICKKFRDVRSFLDTFRHTWDRGPKTGVSTCGDAGRCSARAESCRQNYTHLKIRCIFRKTYGAI